MRWDVSRHDTFEYQRLDASGQIIDILTGVTGCRIIENLNTALKTSGNLRLAEDIDFGDDLLRVVLTAEEADDSVEIALGTFRVSTPRKDRSTASTTIEAVLYSQLIVLDESAFAESFVVTAGSDPLVVAGQIIADCGLEAIVTQPATAFATNVDMVFAAYESKLAIINALMDFCGYSAARVDGYGRVVLAPYERPGGRSPVWTFRDSATSIVTPGMTDEFDWYHIPNVVVVTMTNADETIVKTVRDDDPASRYSTVSRGREIVRHETMTDATDEAAVQLKADRLLESSQAAVNTLTFRHLWAPFALGDVIRMAHAGAGIDYELAVQSRTIDLVPGVPCTTSARRFIRG